MNSAPDQDHSAIDKAMMERCIQLSATAARQDEFPFASIVCEGRQIVTETTNRVAQNGDVTQHAELLAVSEAQKRLGRKDLTGCTIYSNIEPCVMCAFPIREARIGRVVYAISSPLMGGFSRWNVLRDAEISNTMPEAFGPIPEVITGLLWREAEMVWWKWNPVIWGVAKHRGCFGPAEGGSKRLKAVPLNLGFMRRLMMQHFNRHSV
jgi:tRNA(adenine34) deaminase